MNELWVKCPKCQEEFQNPNELREHRLKDHKALNVIGYVK